MARPDHGAHRVTTVLHRHRRPLAISIALAMLIYLGVMLFHDSAALAGALQRITPGVLLALLALSLANYLLRFVRWHRYLKVFGHPVPWREDLRAYLSGFALTTTPGKAGEAIRSLLLQKQGVPASASLAALFVERIFDLVAVLCLAALGALAHPRLVWPVVLLTIMMVTVILVMQTKPALDLLTRFGDRHTGIVQRATHGLVAILSMARIALHPRMIPYSLLIGILAWAAEGLGLWLLLHALGAPLTITTALFIYALAMLAGAITFLPGGLGGTEAAMMLLLIGEGVADSTAVVATIVVRLATLWFAVALGASVLALWSDTEKNEAAAER